MRNRSASANGRSVLVVGANGYFGRLLVDELRALTPLEVVTGGRRDAERLIDLERPETIGPALHGIVAVVCAAGPFQTLPLSLLEACLERRIHYFDFADDRDFVRRARERALDRGAHAAVGVGWSTLPALSALLTSIAALGLREIDSIRIHMAPGNRSPRRHATIASLLHSVGKRFEIRRDGNWRGARGWSEPRAFDFPAPIGRRTGYLVDVADLELFPALFGARTVEFRVGAELALLNRLLNLAATIPGDLARWTPLLRRAAALFGFLGHDWGGVGVEVSDGKQARRATLVAAERGQRIPVLPAVATLSRLLCEDRAVTGLLSLDSWLTREELQSECARRGYALEVGPA